MIVLTEKQRQDLEAGAAVEVEGGSYVLLRKEVFARVKAVLDDAPGDAYPAVDRAFAPGWDAPGMDEYDRYEEHRP